MSSPRKTAIVTGASQGIGAGIVRAFVERGFNVVANSRKVTESTEVAPSDHVALVDGHIGEPATAAKVVETALARFQSIDVLVNNAGYGHTAPFEQMTTQDFRDQVETNLFGVVNLTRAVVPVMREQRAGHIFQVSSAGGRTSTPGLSAYQAAKWAVGGFSDVVAKEVAHMGIRVCTLEPGGMRTDWASEARSGNNDLLPDYEQSVGNMLRLLEAYGGHEISDPAKIAALIVQLSRRDELPLRLLLGGDALHVCSLADAERAEEQERWRETTLSTHFPDAQLPEGLDFLKKPK